MRYLYDALQSEECWKLWLSFTNTDPLLSTLMVYKHTICFLNKDKSHYIKVILFASKYLESNYKYKLSTCDISFKRGKFIGIVYMAWPLCNSSYIMN